MCVVYIQHHKIYLLLYSQIQIIFDYPGSSFNLFIYYLNNIYHDLTTGTRVLLVSSYYGYPGTFFCVHGMYTLRYSLPVAPGTR